MRIRIARGFWTSRFGLWLLASAATLVLAGLVVFTYYYIHFGRLIDERLTGQLFQNTSRVYSAPLPVFIGERLRPEDLAAYLARAGYAETDLAGAPGRFRASGSMVEVRPGARSYFAGGNSLRVDFSGGSVVRLTALSNGAPLVAAELEPSLLTNLFDSAREKRRLVRYEDLPPVMVNAVLAAEDKRFFEHAGFDPIRVLGAAWADLHGSSMMQGASTLDMQVARSFFFTTKREWRRKIKETMVALELEHRFTKQQIFELYANEIYLGNRGSFSIRGFGEAAEAYFGKDVRQLDAGEAAFLAASACGAVRKLFSTI